MKASDKSKPYWKMTAKELAEATKEFDRPIPRHKLRPLTPEQRRLFEKARRQPSKSIYILDHADGKGVLLLQLNSQLVHRSMECARSHNMTWEQFVEKGLQSALSVLEQEPPSTSRKSA